ncbi:MAG: DSBA oxidoreductase [Candidatus Roizmanbacteria bacterium GW2011_GWA2_37_7]|uniref:DSBA oxidoreductase n=1 Tax=Candidatus Roizmanbacteria bacterium GW2011_GWA2_37_7 TaxID=1618481 RepID=A0A0G0H6X8_9BACT|nr:MAG: DSBA oxidoreductase [Candidatus Roizmanbacteria bacterium GW2011_GWA2_37_7]
MEYKKILLLAGGIALTFAFLLGAYYLTSKPKNTFFPQLTKVQKDDHVKWATESANILVEYSDFQCPACSKYTGLLKSLEKDEEFANQVESKVAFVYRHFPLDRIHPYARVAAQAAEAAGIQGKFFEMHDLLFTRQKVWSESDKPEELFKEYANELGLNVEKFEADITSSEISDQIQKDYRSGLEVEVAGTPTFYLNGYKLSPPTSAENFKEILIKGITSQGN